MSPALFADDGNDIARRAHVLAGDRHAEAGGNGGRGMTGAERVVFAFGATGKAGKAILLTQRADAVAAAGENLVRVGLMADVPDDAIMRGIENRVQSHGQFDYAEAGAQMPAGDGNRIDDFGAQFVGKLAQLLAGQGAQVGGRFDRVEQRSLRLFGQAGAPWDAAATQKSLGSWLCQCK
jgi:hypothetical protein